MKTTELFVEQLIIGIVVLLTGATMVWPESAAWLIAHAAGDLEKAALVLIAAYLVGIAYDRVADSLLQCLEQHHRLLFALGRIRAEGKEKRDDPFPENELRTNVMGEAGIAEHADYLRSRIRLTRALTTLVPAMAMACALGRFDGSTRAIVGMTVLIVYLFAFIFRIRPGEKLPAPPVKGRDYALPRTDELRIPDTLAWYEDKIGDGKFGWRFALKNEPLAIVALGLSAGAGVMGAASHRGWPQALVAGGGVFAASLLGTMLFGWSWWRITQTLYDHLSVAGPAKKA